MKDLYEDFNSKYCYKNTNILINKLDIRDYKELSKYEAKITAAKSLGLRLKGITGNFDKKHYLSIHNYLFEDIYPFAGKLREENISKGEFRFASFEYVEPELERILEQLKKENFLEGTSKKQLAERLAYYLSELNVLHPFREGNGRSTRIWLDMILKNRIGKVIDWSKIDKEEYLLAMERSPIKDTEITILLKDALTDKISDREIYMKGIDTSYKYEGYNTYSMDELDK